MEFRPRKVREKRDAARYVLEVVERDKAGEVKREMGAVNARRLLAVLNGIDMATAQELLDKANKEWGMAHGYMEAMKEGAVETGQRKHDKVPIALDDTWIED